MINILAYSEYLAELRVKANAELPADTQIAGCILAAEETHMTKRLGDSSEIMLCASFPDTEKEVINSDTYSEGNRLLLFVLQKVNAGQFTSDQELRHYASLQMVMEKVKEIIIQTEPDCGLFDFEGKIRTEWEYNSFGGFNGLSISLIVTDYD